MLATSTCRTSAEADPAAGSMYQSIDIASPLGGALPGAGDGYHFLMLGAVHTLPASRPAVTYHARVFVDYARAIQTTDSAFTTIAFRAYAVARPGGCGRCYGLGPAMTLADGFIGPAERDDEWIEFDIVLADDAGGPVPAGVYDIVFEVEAFARMTGAAGRMLVESRLVVAGLTAS